MDTIVWKCAEDGTSYEASRDCEVCSAPTRLFNLTTQTWVSESAPDTLPVPMSDDPEPSRYPEEPRSPSGPAEYVDWNPPSGFVKPASICFGLLLVVVCGIMLVRGADRPASKDGSPKHLPPATSARPATERPGVLAEERSPRLPTSAPRLQSSPPQRFRAPSEPLSPGARLVMDLLRVSRPSTDPQRFDTALRALRSYSASQTRRAGDRDAARKKNALGLKAFRAGRYDKALQYFESATRLYPHDAETVNNEGYALLKLRRLGAARTRILDALALAPERSAAWANLGTVLAESGDELLAVGAFFNTWRFSTNRKSTVRFLEVRLMDPETSQAERQAITVALRAARTR